MSAAETGRLDRCPSACPETGMGIGLPPDALHAVRLFEKSVSLHGQDQAMETRACSGQILPGKVFP